MFNFDAGRDFPADLFPPRDFADAARLSAGSEDFSAFLSGAFSSFFWLSSGTVMMVAGADAIVVG